MSSANAIPADYTAITEEQFLQPYGSPDEVISDGHRIAKLIIGDRDTFIHGGLNPLYMDTLTQRLETYSDKVVEADTAISTENSVKTAWKDGEQRGYALKREFHHHYPFLYRNNSSVLSEVKEVISGSGRSDMILDLKKFAAIGKSNPAELENANLFDINWLDESAQLHIELTDLLAQLEAAPKDTKELTFAKNQAFTFLEIALNEIREYARYIFHGNEEKLKQYKRDYWKR